VFKQSQVGIWVQSFSARNWSEFSGVARVPYPGAKIFAPPPTKLQSLKVKNRRKSVKEANAEHLLFGLCSFSDSNKTL